LDDQGEIDEGELRRYTDWLIGKGVHGLYPNGSTGEFTRFTPEERRRIVKIMASEARGRVPILAGAAEANVKETLKACEYYQSLGIRAVAIVSPIYYKLSPAAVYAYFAEIGRHTPIDVTLYNIPMFASPIDVPTVARLAAEFPRIVAIKDSSGDLAHMIRLIQAVRPQRPDFSFLTGWDPILMPSLLIGCDGGTHATSGVVPEVTRLLYDLTTAGKLDEARQVQYRLITLFDAMILQADFPEGVREALKLRGFKAGHGRQPLTGEQHDKLQLLSRSMQCILAESGYADEPIGGCPAKQPAPGTAVDSAQVERIVQGVLAELTKQPHST
jgi:4-hydroxy-tetrahydrodipicolinate synthase